SRAILLLGGLGVLCVLLAAGLLTQLIEADTAAPADDAAPLPAASSPAPAAPIADPAAPPVLSAETRTSLLDAYDEPLLAEIAAALDAAHTVGAALHPTLTPFLADLVQRMHTAQEPYRARVFAPAQADHRAEQLRTLFRNAGLNPDLLIISGHTGPDGVAVERA